jgi:hypothetical protein
MDYLSGEYEAFICDGESSGEVVVRVSVECLDPDRCDRKLVEGHLIDRFLKHKPGLASRYHDGELQIPVTFTAPGGLELHHLTGRPKRLVDRRKPV